MYMELSTGTKVFRFKDVYKRDIKSVDSDVLRWVANDWPAKEDEARGRETGICYTKKATINKAHSTEGKTDSASKELLQMHSLCA